MEQLIAEIREQIQEDLLTAFDFLDGTQQSVMCQIVVDNFKKFKEEDS